MASRLRGTPDYQSIKCALISYAIARLGLKAAPVVDHLEGATPSHAGLVTKLDEIPFLYTPALSREERWGVRMALLGYLDRLMNKDDMVDQPVTS